MCLLAKMYFVLKDLCTSMEKCTKDAEKKWGLRIFLMSGERPPLGDKGLKEDGVLPSP